MNTETTDNANFLTTKQRRTFQRSCRVKLTDPEMKAYGQALANATAEAGIVQAQAKNAAEEWKGKLATVTTQISRYAGLIRDEHEQRVVDCYKVLHKPTNRVLTKRVDNDEVVDEKAADLEDLARFSDEDRRDREIAEKAARAKKKPASDDEAPVDVPSDEAEPESDGPTPTPAKPRKRKAK
jgi:hypothetical protein